VGRRHRLWDADPVGNVSAQPKLVLDLAGEHSGSRGRLVDKVATAFTSSQTEHGGQESTTLALNNTLCHRGGDHRSTRVHRPRGLQRWREPLRRVLHRVIHADQRGRGIFRKKAEARAEALELLRAA
jgi:multimeric flavodoxin WrbA